MQLAELPLIPALDLLIARKDLCWIVRSDIVAAAISSWDEPTWLWALPPRSCDPWWGRGLSSGDLRISALEPLLRRICGLRLLRGHGIGGAKSTIATR